jgi:hypothetical protein
MTFPAASFTAVAPPPDGLLLAFTSARRRRNSKAAVSAFGGAVAIASALSFLVPPGQSLVQEPAQPAHGGLLPGLPAGPQHGSPAVRTPVRTPMVSAPSLAAPATRTPAGASAPSIRIRPESVPTTSCGRGRALACAAVPSPIDGGPAVRATVCPAAASVTVEYDAPPVGPTRLSISRTFEVGSCPA